MKKLILLFLIILFYIKTQNIYANQNTFTVDNIEISGKLSSESNNNREKYLNLGFTKGFKNLVINLVRKKDQKKIIPKMNTDLKSRLHLTKIKLQNFFMIIIFLIQKQVIWI